MRITVLTLLILLSLVGYTQDNFTITGKIERLSKSKSVIVSGSFGQFNGLINSDGSFKIIGTVKDAGPAFIKTDSSGSDGIWITPGNYFIECKEINFSLGGAYYLRTPVLKGPIEAEIYHGYLQPMYYPKGNPREFYKHHIGSYLDSIFNRYPTSLVLPEMIRYALPFIGDDASAFYNSLLSNEQKADSSASQLTYYFKRKEKITKEIYFSDFQMLDSRQKMFRLSSLDKKLILIDFWSSDCFPCRKKHEKLVSLYKKYASKGLEIVSVSLDDNKAEWMKAIKADEMTWINVSELKGWKTSLAEAYYVKSLPFSLWLDKDRKIMNKELTEEEIEEFLK
jgi:thiol-disulfide isomerase/thioredoxin